MSANYLGISLNNLNNNLGNVTVATSAPSADFYFQILTTTYKPTKEQCFLALKMFQDYIMSNGMPAGNAGVDIPVL